MLGGSTTGYPNPPVVNPLLFVFQAAPEFISLVVKLASCESLVSEPPLLALSAVGAEAAVSAHTRGGGEPLTPTLQRKHAGL